MTRILQIRRGSAAQNDNFTGLAGEITMDTTNKTLRVHDGETLGGFALARQDSISGFDISSVPNTFWNTLFATYQPNSINSLTSDALVLSNSAYLDYEFDYAHLPARAEVVLVCLSPEAGYSIDDEVRAFGVGAFANPAVNTYIQNGALHVRFFIGGQNIWVFHKTDANPVNINNSNWKLKFIVYY